jgi:hypothetical protein
MDRVQLLDPETGERLISLDRLDLSERSSQFNVALGQATLDARKVHRLSQLLRTRLASQTTSSHREATLSCKTLSVVDATSRVVLHHVTGTAQSLESSVEASLSFAIGHHADSPRVAIEMVRDRGQPTLQTRIDLNTGDVAMPVGIFSPVAKHRLGADVVFRGTCRAVYRNDQWHHCVVSGVLDHVESGRWIVDPIPYRLTGKGRVELKRLEISQHGIEELIGRIQIERGTIDTALLQSLEKFELITLEDAIELHNHDDAPLMLHDVAVDVRMDANGLTIRAPPQELTQTSRPRPLATSAEGQAILEPEHRLPVDRLVFAIVPQGMPEAYHVARRFQQMLP